MKYTSCNLIPDTVNPSPDYYCTWQTQLYATSDGKPEGQRAILGEHALFGGEKPFGWAYFYPEARRDLIFVMDDSWDVPPDNDRSWYGSLLLNGEKFPEAAVSGDNGRSLRRLSDRIRSIGWKGLGGWVCAQESKHREISDREAYWTQCLQEANIGALLYWKVDWGRRCLDADFRRRLTELGRIHAPRLTVEHAKIHEVLTCSDVFRTYDVPAIFSIPMTMEKLKQALLIGVTESGCVGLVNCEDEAYMAAAGGFAMGIMRHPFRGPLPNGRADMSFPSVHRDLKTKMCEVLRAVRWHRIAPAFAVDCRYTRVSALALTDTWRFDDRASEMEEWWFSMPLIGEKLVGDTVTVTAPAAIARNCGLPCVEADGEGEMPYVIASRNPNGAFSVATLGRTRERRYWIPRCRVSAEIGDAVTVSVFGEYAELILRTDGNAVSGVLAQDLASERAVDITEEVRIEKDSIVIPGALIRAVGTSAQSAEDTSEPGLVLRIVRAS
ncbi:MAG: hypothetical protein IJD59_01830 [Clostridia bacterium]|nr:hypothetical protein [Clostridia bacterium]